MKEKMYIHAGYDSLHNIVLDGLIEVDLEPSWWPPPSSKAALGVFCANTGDPGRRGLLLHSPG